MKQNFELALYDVLKHEGGFVNHPKDPGGATNKGVTLSTYQRYFGDDKTVEDLKTIPDAHVAYIYRKGYWDAARCDQLPSGLDLVVFDAAVNSGTKRAVEWLQAAVGSPADGLIGPNTLAAAASADTKNAIREAINNRILFLASLSNFKTFGHGWTRRATKLLTRAYLIAASE